MKIEILWRGFALLDIFVGTAESIVYTTDAGVRLVRIRCFAVLTGRMPSRGCESLSTRNTISDRSSSWATGSVCSDASIGGEGEPLAIARAQ